MLEVNYLLCYLLQLRLVLVLDLTHFLVELLFPCDYHLLLIRMHFFSPFEALYEFFAEELQSLLGVPVSRLLFLVLLVLLLLEDCFQLEIFLVLEN